MQTVEVAKLNKSILDELYADLKGSTDPGGAMEGDFFRYEIFAKRLIAAEYGRPDAVTWALEWHAGLLKDRAEKAQLEEQRINRREDEKRQANSEFLSGRVGNRIYQAFLDTVEVPADVKNNVAYFAFHSDRTVEFNKSNCGLSFPDFVRNYADQHLSDRVKKQMSVSPIMI
jgi:hypothetical protein